jgi:hypothetical protein
MDINDLNSVYKYLYDGNTELKSICETAISSSSYHSYIYAANVLRARFELGEDAIATNASYSYMYARDVINTRFIAGEASILKIPSIIAKYARNVIKGPWPEAEEYLIGDQLSTFIYLVHIPNTYNESLFSSLRSTYKSQYKNWFLRGI